MVFVEWGELLKAFAIIAVLLVFGYIESNKLKVGTCFSSASKDERVKRPVLDFIEITVGQLCALCCIKQHYRKEKKRRVSFRNAYRISCQFTNDMISLVNEKYPQNGFFDTDRKVVLVSSSANRKVAVKDFNGQAMTNGTTQISYAYFELWNTDKDIPQSLKEDLFVNILLHEAGHHIFRQFTGMHIPNRKIRFISYIDECFADLACFKMMGKTGREAANIMRYKYDKILCAKDNDKCTKSHPSNNYRIKSLEKGVFGEETIRDIADYINENKGAGYISDKLVEEVCENIRKYSILHPELELFFNLKNENVA